VHQKKEKQTLDIIDGDMLCRVPLTILVPKLTLTSTKALANLHDMYMPSKILAVNARILLENHKCETCPDLLALFRPYKIASSAERQKFGMRKIKRNVLSTMSVVIQHLNIERTTKPYRRNTIGPRKT